MEDYRDRIGVTRLFKRIQRVLVISPHFDDGALSVGAVAATLVAHDTEVQFATVFGGLPPGRLSPAAQAFHRRCGLGDDAMVSRSGEDAAACRRLGVEPLHGLLPEALYRCDPDGLPYYPSSGALFGADPDHEPMVVRVVADHLQQLLSRLRPQALIAPLGVGAHVDHLIVRWAASQCRLGGIQQYWYEDLPYALYDHLRGWESTHATGLVPVALEVDEVYWAVKTAAVSEYRSQLDVLWFDSARWEQQLRDYAVTIGAGRPAERLWRR